MHADENLLQFIMAQQSGLAWYRRVSAFISG
jgi:hypothetical protein